MADQSSQVAALLLTRHGLAVSPPWIRDCLSTMRAPLPPLPALTSTAQFRLLASDFTHSLSTSAPSNLFPGNINDPSVKERRLGGKVPCQILDVEDIGSSKWSQVEALERVERGEEVRGREVIRTLPAEDTAGSAEAGPGKSSGPHRYVLQDAKGTKVTAFEKEKVPKLGIGENGMFIGMKLILGEGTLVRRGIVMLTPERVTVLGGKIEAWDKGWREGRKDRLLRSVEQGQDRR